PLTLESAARPRRLRQPRAARRGCAPADCGEGTSLRLAELRADEGARGAENRTVGLAAPRPSGVGPRPRRRQSSSRTAIALLRPPRCQGRSGGAAATDPNLPFDLLIGHAGELLDALAFGAKPQPPGAQGCARSQPGG